MVYPITCSVLHHLLIFCEEGTHKFPLYNLWMPIYSVFILTVLMAKMLPAGAFASSSDVSKMSHVAFDLFANTFTIQFRHLSASAIHSLLIASNFPAFILDVSREIVLFEIAYQTAGMDRS